MNISFCTVVLSLIQGIALNTGVLPLAKGGALQVARSQGTGGIRYVLQYRYTTRTRISTWITLEPNVAGLRGTQLAGSVIYTLVTISSSFHFTFSFF
jgi:hypothetical protein